MKLFRLSIHLSSIVILLPSFASAHSESRDSINYISTVEDVVINTKSGRVNHLSNFDLTFYLHHRQQRVKFGLSPNHDILAEDASVQYLDLQGNIKHSKDIVRHEHKVFKGNAWVQDVGGKWNEAGWARIYLKRDGRKPLMEGVFRINGDHHHIQLRSTYAQLRRNSDIGLADNEEESMIVYRDSDMLPQGKKELKRDASDSASCGADDLAFNWDPDHSIFRPRSEDSMTSWTSMLFKPSKRQSGNIGTGDLRATIGNAAGCPTERRVALVGIATDCTYTASFDSAEAVRANIISVVNSASDVYESTFNVTLGLRNITISDAVCPTTAQDAARWNIPCDQGDIEDRLDLFSRWRGAVDNGNDGNAYWTLMSTCSSGRSVGLAWLGQLCVSGMTGYGGQSVSGANVVVRTPGEWQVFAHESAHTFGAVHDCDSSSCQSTGASRCCPISSSGCNANGQYLMSPVSGSTLTEFSPCSIGNVCSNLGRNRVRDGCLTPNRNLTTINGSQCGNGIVEAGEDCDCGGEEGCGDNACCDPTTCRFAEQAVCDDFNDACCSSCRFTASGTVCRTSSGICDVEETCTGSSSTCPTDEFLPNGQGCGTGSGLTCASGQCTSRDLQCQTTYDPVSSNNYTNACDSSSCTLTCASGSSQFGCMAMDQNFLDGTPCSGGGICGSGRCRSSSNDVVDSNNNGGGSSSGGSSWFDRNRSLVIGLSAGLGSLVVLILLCCIVSCWRSRSRKRKQAAMPPPPQYTGQYYQNGPAPAYPGAIYPNYNPRQGRVSLVRYA